MDRVRLELHDGEREQGHNARDHTAGFGPWVARWGGGMQEEEKEKKKKKRLHGWIARVTANELR